MGRQQRKNQAQRDATPPPAPPAGTSWLPVGTLVGVVVLLLISISNWRRIDEIQENLDARLTQLDNRLAQVSEKVDKMPAQQANNQPRRGPDPDKVYQIKTAGAPAKGPVDAPIVIAEFSDFQ